MLDSDRFGVCVCGSIDPEKYVKYARHSGVIFKHVPPRGGPNIYIQNKTK